MVKRRGLGRPRLQQLGLGGNRVGLAADSQTLRTIDFCTGMNRQDKSAADAAELRALLDVE